LTAFLTFSQKQWNRHLRGVKELGRPFLSPRGKVFRTLGAGNRAPDCVRFTHVE
jgi:hypothetical protein